MYFNARHFFRAHIIRILPSEMKCVSYVRSHFVRNGRTVVACVCRWLISAELMGSVDCRSSETAQHSLYVDSRGGGSLKVSLPLRLNCAKFDLGWGASSALPNLLTGFQGATSVGRMEGLGAFPHFVIFLRINHRFQCCYHMTYFLARVFFTFIS